VEQLIKNIFTAEIHHVFINQIAARALKIRKIASMYAIQAHFLVENVKIMKIATLHSKELLNASHTSQKTQMMKRILQ